MHANIPTTANEPGVCGNHVPETIRALINNAPFCSTPIITHAIEDQANATNPIYLFRSFHGIKKAENPKAIAKNDVKNALVVYSPPRF